MIYLGPESRLQRALDAGAVIELADCDDCNRPTGPDDAAPSCGGHVLCCSCFNTSDFRCRECARVWDEIARAELW